MDWGKPQSSPSSSIFYSNPFISSWILQLAHSDNEDDAMMSCCSSRSCAILVALLAILAASLPTLMASLLRHMFTAPNQIPWMRGSLRLINCTGIPAQPLNSADRIKELSDPENKFHKEGDVWVASYVKSGTTWTIGLLAALTGHPAAEYSGNLQKTTRNFCPQPELPDLGWGDDGFGHSLQELAMWPTRPRYFKAHWPSRDFLSPELTRRAKTIYVMRNPLDQMISHWNQVWGMGFHYGTEDRTFEGGWSGFVDDWLDGDVENGRWSDHVAGWYQRSLDEPGKVMLVRYEELKADTARQAKRIAKFLGMEEPDEAKMSRVLELTSFERMREADENDVGLKFLRWLGVLRKRHIRQGEIRGGFELTLSEEQMQALEHQYQVELKPLGMRRDWVFVS